MLGKYSVKEAVWFAAAIHAYLAFKNGKKDIKDYCLTANELQKAAQFYTESKVQNARIYQHYNGDHSNCTERYLRRLRIEDNLCYRVTATGEFNGVKEHPVYFYSDKNSDISVKTESGYTVSFKEIKDFIDGEYMSIINGTVSDKEIDYLGILDYLNNNQELQYSNPNADDITNEEKEKFQEMEVKGQWVIEEMKKIARKCNSLLGIDTYDPGDWLDGSGTKTKKYLWTQLKYEKYFDSPISISIFAEKEDEKTRYRISLELKNDGVKKEIVEQYHKHLDLSLEEGMTYTIHTNKWGNPISTTESVDSLKAKLDSGEERKIQLCIYVNPDKKTNEQLDKEVIEAVEKIIPYYKYVLGIEDDKWWPSLNDYNPNLSVEDWVEILCDKDVMSTEKMDLLFKMKELGGISTCAKLAEIYGGNAITYKNIGQDIGRLIHHKYNIPFFNDNGVSRMFTIPFVGKDVIEDSKSRYAWKIREPLMDALSKIDWDEEIIMNQNDNYDLNMILYGPPGTGKTYNSAIYAVAICDNKKVEELTDYSAVMDRYNELKKEGRIAFTTFHQSYGYEEFIEGIKPVLGKEDGQIGYTIEAGAFKKFCENAKKVSVTGGNTNLIKDEPRIWGMLLDGTGNSVLKQECFASNVIRLGFNEVNDDDIQGEFYKDENSSWNAKHMVNDFINVMEQGDIVVIVGKTVKTIDAIGVVTGDYVFDESLPKFKRTRTVQWLFKGIDQDMVSYLSQKGRKQFGRNSIFAFDYIGIDAIYEILKKNGVQDTLEISKEDKPFVFIIDEINRGNISKIFGELITLIEDTKREGQLEAAFAILPYSGEEFSVPSNVYILGTMNTADRSIQLMDTALRRRFKFIEKMPDADILRNLGINDVDFGGTTLNIPRMLEAINDRIAYLFDREHTIGHAFFTGLKEDHSIEKLATIFEKSVIPLLQEYFYEDYQKIQLVLGDNAKTDENLKFIKNTPVKLKELFMGNVEDIVDEQEVKYEINHDAFMNIEAYKTIANDL